MAHCLNPVRDVYSVQATGIVTAMSQMLQVTSHIVTSHCLKKFSTEGNMSCSGGHNGPCSVCTLQSEGGCTYSSMSQIKTDQEGDRHYGRDDGTS
jgi:hypothetical protein